MTLDNNETVRNLRDSRTDPEYLMQLINELEQEDEAEIDIPEKNKLHDQRVYMQDMKQHVNINGVWTHPALGFIANMLETGTSPIIIVVGKEGYGKSYTALTIGYHLHKMNVLRNDFDPKNQAVYDVIEFLFFYMNNTRQVAMFDEAAETLNKNDYHSRMNKAVSGALRTQRKREMVNIFVLPDLNELDGRIVEKVDLLVNMRSKREAEFTIYEKKHAKRGNRGLDYNFWSNLPNWNVPDVPDELAENYEKIDNSFKGNYLRELLIQSLNERIEDIRESQTVEL